jgi:hypothetical protein
VHPSWLGVSFSTKHVPPPSFFVGKTIVDTSTERIPTSQLFRAILSDTETNHVTLAWILAGLRERSFGMIMLVLGLVAMLPGIGVVAGVVLLALGFQMMMAYEAPFIPAIIGQRLLPTSSVTRLMARTIPIMRALEAFIRPRWHTPFVATKRLVGVVVLLLAITLFLPVPLSNIIPGALTMLVAFAYLEEDGALLCAALAASFASLAITAGEIWAALQGASFLFQK